MRIAPAFAGSIVNAVDGPEVSGSDIRRRLGYARQVFESIDLCVAPSRSIADEFCRLGLSRDRVQVSDYGFRRTAAQSRARREHRTPLVIGFVGTLVWHKGAHVLIEAARKIRGRFEVRIYGDTNVFPEYVASLRRAAVGLPIFFQNGFDRESVTDVYGGLDLLVVPSLWPENSPLVIHEAFMQGVPVVAARVGGVPELVAHDTNGLLYDAFDVESLASSLQRSIDDVSLVARWSEAVRAVKSLEQDAGEWEERYRALTARPADVQAWA